MPVKILVVDDHVLIREALRGVLRELKGEAAVIEAPDWGEAAQQLEQNPDVGLVLLDLGLPDRDGFEVLGELGLSHPAVPVVVLSASRDRDSVQRALDLGALGFIPKSTPREVMLGAFELVFAGGIYIPPEILGREGAAALAPPTPGERAAAGGLALTGRQSEVLALMMQGKSNKAIGRALDLAEPTVKVHVSAILEALGAANRTEAVMAAAARGFAAAGRQSGQGPAGGVRRPKS